MTPDLSCEKRRTWSRGEMILEGMRWGRGEIGTGYDNVRIAPVRSTCKYTSTWVWQLLRVIEALYQHLVLRYANYQYLRTHIGMSRWVQLGIPWMIDMTSYVSLSWNGCSFSRSVRWMFSFIPILTEDCVPGGCVLCQDLVLLQRAIRKYILSEFPLRRQLTIASCTTITS